MPDDKRRTILCATLHLLSERGFHGFSMKQLAERAGVAAGTIYLYFRDKEDLIRRLHEDIVCEVAKHLFANQDDSLPLSEQYRRIGHNLWHFSLSKPQIMLSKGQFDSMPPDVLFGARGESMAAVLEKREDALDVFAPMIALYERGRATHQLKPLPDEVLSALCIDPLCNLAREQHLGLIDLQREDLDAVLDACWDAVSR